MLVLDNPHHGEFASADATALSEANSRFVLYNIDKTALASLGANDQVVITDLEISVDADMVVQIYDGADTTVAVGETISHGLWPANGGISVQMRTPHFCKKGTWPKVKTSTAGNVRITIRGHIISR